MDEDAWLVNDGLDFALGEERGEEEGDEEGKGWEGDQENTSEGDGGADQEKKGEGNKEEKSAGEETAVNDRIVTDTNVKGTFITLIQIRFILIGIRIRICITALYYISVTCIRICLSLIRPDPHPQQCFILYILLFSPLLSGSWILSVRVANSKDPVPCS